MSYQGDYDAGSVIRFKFNTFRPTTGAPFALAGSPSLIAFKDDSDVQDTDGLTLTASFDSRDGLNHVVVDTTADATFYSNGSSFQIVLAAGTVDGVSVANVVVGSFTLRKDSSLKPTTPGRALDVSTGGEAGIDWANIGSPTTAVNLSATNIDVDQVVASVSGAVGSVTGNVGGSVASVATDGITSASLAASAIAEIQSGLATSAALADVDADVVAIKAKTDQLTFSGANLLSDIRAVRGDTIIENGSASTNWGAAP